MCSKALSCWLTSNCGCNWAQSPKSEEVFLGRWGHLQWNLICCRHERKENS